MKISIVFFSQRNYNFGLILTLDDDISDAIFLGKREGKN